MKKYGKLYNNINNMLSHVRASLPVLKEAYKKYGNDAPVEVIKRSMDKLQKRLDKAKLFY